MIIKDINFFPKNKKDKPTYVYGFGDVNEEDFIPDNSISLKCPHCKGLMVYPLLESEKFAKFPVEKCSHCGKLFKFGNSLIEEYKKHKDEIEQFKNQKGSVQKK